MARHSKETEFPNQYSWYLASIGFSSTCVNAAEVLSGHGHPSVNSGFSEPLPGSRPKFVGSYLSTISPDHFFYLFKILLFFHIFFALKWEPMGPTVSKGYLSHKSLPIFHVSFKCHKVTFSDLRFFFIFQILWNFEILTWDSCKDYTYICKVLFMPDCFNSVRVIRGNFQNFRC